MLGFEWSSVECNETMIIIFFEVFLIVLQFVVSFCVFF